MLHEPSAISHLIAFSSTPPLEREKALPLPLRLWTARHTAAAPTPRAGRQMNTPGPTLSTVPAMHGTAPGTVQRAGPVVSGAAALLSAPGFPRDTQSLNSFWETSDDWGGKRIHQYRS